MSYLSPGDVNESALAYWTATGYSVKDYYDVFVELDNTYMIALFTFNGSGDVEMRLSKRTWERQEGHYPSVAKYLTVIAHHPLMIGVKGSVAVWLEDGLWEWNRPVGRRVPMFAFGRNVHDYHALLMPDPAFIHEQGYAEELDAMRPLGELIPWNERVPTIFWRGAASGLGIEGDNWQKSPRAALALRARELNQPSMFDARLTRFSHLEPERQNEMVEAGLTAEELPFHEFYHYKYLVDVDGYACAWRSLFLKLSTGSVVLKVESPFMQWYYPGLKPWRHYIPLSADLREIPQLYEWLTHHDEQVLQIARQGEDFIRSIEYFSTIEPMARTCRALIEAQRPE